MRRTFLFFTSIFCFLLQGSVIGQSGIPVTIPDTLDLPTVLAYALENNFTILQAKQRIKEQEGLIVEISSQALPEATLNANYNQLDSGLSETFGGLFDANTENWNIALNVRQALYKGGGVKAALRIQDLLEEAVLYDLKAAINLALLEVKIRFYDVLLARESIGVQKQNIELLNDQLQDAKNRLAAGAVSKFEVLRAEVELANAKPELIRARNGFYIAIEELRQVMGFTGLPEEVNKLPGFVGSLDFEPKEFDLIRALEIAKHNRPE